MTSSTPILTAQQVRDYWRDGYLSGIPVLREDQMSIARQKLVNLELKEVQENPSRWVDPAYQPWSQPGSPWWHWFQGMVRHPTIVGAVQCLLGPNVLIRNADVFVKPVGSTLEIGWHTDTTASEHDADKMLTAWVAISHSRPSNGCMEWLTGSHRQPLPPEIKDKYSLSFNDESTLIADAAEHCANVLSPGELSLHHFRTIHRSKNNSESSPRIGLVIRFMASDTPLAVAEAHNGTLVAGENVPGHFTMTKQFPVSWNNRTTTPQMSG